MGQHAGITPAETRKPKSRGGSTCRNNGCRNTQTLKSRVVQHAGTVGQLAQEWWVNMGRNLQEAFQSRNWLKCVFWLAIGIVFFIADIVRKDINT